MVVKEFGPQLLTSFLAECGGRQTLVIQSAMQRWQDGVTYLAQHGLNLFAVLDTAVLPSHVESHLVQAGVPLASYSRLVLIGNGGRAFWQALLHRPPPTADPVDDFSEMLTRRFIADYVNDMDVFWLFPSERLIPLQQLGGLAGWGHSSPLGLQISARYGLWFAYRAAFLTNADLPVVVAAPTPSPCATCEHKPCVAACPATAVHPASPLDLTACLSHRTRPASSCADRCLARLACPVAPEHRYEMAQVRYHYGRSLAALNASGERED